MGVPAWVLFGAMGVALVQDARAAEVLSADVVAVLAPGGLVGGQPARVHVLARSTDGAPIAGLELAPRASAGQVSDWRAEGAGWYSFAFTPPETSAPVDVRLSVAGPGRAGPVESALEVRVHPAGPATVQIHTADPHLVLGQDRSTTVRFQIEGDLDGAELLAAVSAGELSALRAEGGGRFTATYTAPAVNFPHLAVITVAARDRADLIAVGVLPLHGSVQFPVEAPAGTQVSLQVDGQTYGPVQADAQGRAAVPIVVRPGTGSAQRVGAGAASRIDLQIPETRRIAAVPVGYPAQVGAPRAVHWVVRRADGAPDPSAPLQIEAEGGAIGPVTHLGEGVYQALFTPDQPGTHKLVARFGAEIQQAELQVPTVAAFPAPGAAFTPPAPSSGGVAEVVVVPVQRTVGAGAKHKVELILAAVDPVGHPVPGVKLALTASMGSVPAAATTGPDGVARVMFTAGKSTGLASVLARVGEKGGAASLLVANGELPGLGWPRSEGAQGRWEALVPGAVAASGTEAPPVEVGALDRLELTLPPTASAGGELELVVRAVDAAGRAVPDPAPTLTVQGGEAGPLQPAGEGRYTARIQLPADGIGELVVQVQSGAVQAETTRPIDPAAVSDRVPRPPRDPSDRVRLRAHLAGAVGAYDYAQRPSDTPGPLLDRPLVVGGEDGQGLAVHGGGELDVRAWVLPWLGARALGRITRFALHNDTFTEPIPDWLVRGDVDLALRAPVRVGDDLVWIGLNGGFSLDDLQVYTGCLQPGCAVAYEPVLLPGLGLGATVGAEVGRFHFVGGVQQGLAYGRVPHRIGVEAELGVGLTEALRVVLGFDAIRRRVLVQGQTSGATFGELRDTQLLGSLGIGWQH